MLNAVMAATLSNLLRIVVVMSLRMVLIVEAEFRIRRAVGPRANVGAHASCVGLERQHIQVAHHLHVLASFVSFGNFDFDRWRIRVLPSAGSDTRSFPAQPLAGETRSRRSGVLPSGRCPGIHPICVGPALAMIAEGFLLRPGQYPTCFDPAHPSASMVAHRYLAPVVLNKRLSTRSVD